MANRPIYSDDNGYRRRRIDERHHGGRCHTQAFGDLLGDRRRPVLVDLHLRRCPGARLGVAQNRDTPSAPHDRLDDRLGIGCAEGGIEEKNLGAIAGFGGFGKRHDPRDEISDRARLAGVGRRVGLDAGDPAFWGKGLSVIEGFIDELEAME